MNKSNYLIFNTKKEVIIFSISLILFYLLFSNWDAIEKFVKSLL